MLAKKLIHSEDTSALYFVHVRTQFNTEVEWSFYFSLYHLCLDIFVLS